MVDTSTPVVTTTTFSLLTLVRTPAPKKRKLQTTHASRTCSKPKFRNLCARSQPGTAQHLLTPVLASYAYLCKTKNPVPASGPSLVPTSVVTSAPVPAPAPVPVPAPVVRIKPSKDLGTLPDAEPLLQPQVQQQPALHSAFAPLQPKNQQQQQPQQPKKKPFHFQKISHNSELPKSRYKVHIDYHRKTNQSDRNNRPNSSNSRPSAVNCPNNRTLIVDCLRPKVN
ncbi:hypothetical protein HK102_012777, partial [Quaeritorhiza haematococci]